MPNYIVKDGDCTESIAFERGLFWKKVWDHSKNFNLREKRKDPNVLFPGDVVFVPEKEEKQEPGATEQRHRFKRKGIPSSFNIQVFSNGEPRGNQQYILDIDGVQKVSQTDKEGWIRTRIPPNARSGRIIFTKGNFREIVNLKLGHLDPVDEITGLQQRLSNLGFDCIVEKGTLGPHTKEALKKFQKKNSLPETGEVNDATRVKLKAEHGC